MIHKMVCVCGNTVVKHSFTAKPICWNCKNIKKHTKDKLRYAMGKLNYRTRGRSTMK